MKLKNHRNKGSAVHFRISVRRNDIQVIVNWNATTSDYHLYEVREKTWAESSVPIIEIIQVALLNNISLMGRRLGAVK